MKEDVFRRLLNWEHALNRAARNLAIAQHLSNHGAKDWETIEAFDGKSFRTVVAVEAQQGLREAAIIGFLQVFGWGKGSPEIAKNDDGDIETIRKEMVQYTLTTLGLADVDFQRIMEEIKKQRDERIAHYDGNKAEYERVNSFIEKMNMPGSALRSPDTDLLLRIAWTMREFVHQKWVAMAMSIDAERKRLANDLGAG